MSCRLAMIPRKVCHRPDLSSHNWWLLPPWHLPQTVADVSPPRNSTGSYLMPLMGWRPSRTMATSQGPGEPSRLWTWAPRLSCMAVAALSLLLACQILHQPILSAVSPPSVAGEPGSQTNTSGSCHGVRSRVMRGSWKMVGISQVLAAITLGWAG